MSSGCPCVLCVRTVRAYICAPGLRHSPTTLSSFLVMTLLLVFSTFYYATPINAYGYVGLCYSSVCVCPPQDARVLSQWL